MVDFGQKVIWSCNCSNCMWCQTHHQKETVWLWHAPRHRWSMVFHCCALGELGYQPWFVSIKGIPGPNTWPDYLEPSTGLQLFSRFFTNNEYRDEVLVSRIPSSRSFAWRKSAMLLLEAHVRLQLWHTAFRSTIDWWAVDTRELRSRVQRAYMWPLPWPHFSCSGACPTHILCEF